MESSDTLVDTFEEYILKEQEYSLILPLSVHPSWTVVVNGSFMYINTPLISDSGLFRRVAFMLASHCSTNSLATLLSFG